MTEEIKTYRVIAEMSTYLQTEVKATSEEEAQRIAKELDGADFEEIQNEGNWEIHSVQEVSQ